MRIEATKYSEHQSRLKVALKRILSEAGELLSLSYPHDYRQHSVITLSRALKHRTQKLLLALAGEEEGEEGEERSSTVERRVKDVENAAIDLKREVDPTT